MRSQQDYTHWLKGPTPTQSRHPRLTALLEAQAARQRLQEKRAFRRRVLKDLGEEGLRTLHKYWKLRTL
jgi:hypothetical protein